MFCNLYYVDLFIMLWCVEVYIPAVLELIGVCHDDNDKKLDGM